jgi:hypothetical protein
VILRASMLVLALLVGVLHGCGAAGGPDGGGANLPDRGIAPWTATDEDPAIPGLDGLTVRHPTALGESVTGEGVALLAEVEGPDGPAIARLLRQADGDSFGAPEVLLADARSPAAVRDGMGAMRLVWVEADGVIATGVLAEDTATPEIEAVERTGVPGESPSIALTAEGALVVFAVEGGRVVRFDLASPAAVEEVLTPGEGCVDTSGEAATCWDASAIVDADVRRATTATGREVWRMVYTARSGDSHAFGFAASWDGHRWSRYVWNPILKPPVGSRRPTVIPDGQRYLMYFGRVSGKGVGRAVHDSGVVSERW